MKTQTLFANLFSYFIRGLIIIAPIALTLYIIYSTLNIVDSWVNNLFEYIFGVRLPGLGLLAVIAIVVAVGMMGSTFIIRQIAMFFEKIFSGAPILKMIYDSLKDLFNALMGDKSKFDAPVLIRMNEREQIYKMGFVTQETMKEFTSLDLVAVYMPHSYNFSGELFLVPRSHIGLIENMTTSEAMKFIVSGGITTITD